MYKIITAMPTRGLIFTKAEMALEQELLNNGQIPFILRTDNLPIPDCRNTLIETALNVPEWTHILLMDDDVIMPEGSLKELLEADTDIAFIDYPMHYNAGRYAKMGTASYDNWLPGEDWHDKEVAWAGLGCVLVKREVIEKMSKPYFDKLVKGFIRDDEGKIILKDGEPGMETAGGEDVYFYFKARELGFKIKPIHSKVCGHARLVRVVLALQNGKYTQQHKIGVNSVIERPFQ